jgi:hypothetical protein
MMPCPPNRAVTRAIQPLLVLVVALCAGATAFAQTVTVYEDLDYTGASTPATGDIHWIGPEWNDGVTSIQIPGGVSVTVFEHADYGGASLTLTASTSDLRNFQGPGADGTWNDAISSARISYSSSTTTKTVLLVNGSFNPYPDWMEPWSGQYQSIAATYNVQPVPFRWTDSDLAGVLWPYYSGIQNGAVALGGAINALPPGDVYLVTHSHGGNVALGATQFYTNRPVQRIINLATPVNFDIRYSNAPWASHMCTASSWDDWVQFFGASPYQVYNFMEQSYYGYQYGYMSTEAFINGNYSDAAYYAYLAYDYIMAGYSWFESTKLELWGWTIAYNDGGHGDMHEPPVWNGLPGSCKQ